MLQVAFHFNVADPVDYVSRLVRKVRSRQMTVLVCAEPADVTEIDQRLWTLNPDGFLAHATQEASEAVRLRSPVLLCSACSAQESRQVLVNMRSQPPNLQAGVERLVEIVPTDEPSRAAARQRWRTYVAQGLTPERHDVAAGPNP